jgi:hypothetical protein
MVSLVRLLLLHYDRYGVVALISWLGCLVVVIAIPSVIAQQFFVNYLDVSISLAGFPVILLISPIVIYVFLAFQSTILLLNERLFMLLGFYKLFGWKPHRFRKLIQKLVSENKDEN